MIYAVYHGSRLVAITVHKKYAIVASMSEDFGQYAQEHARMLTPPVCENLEPRWTKLFSEGVWIQGEMRDPQTGIVLARFYEIDARVDPAQQTLPDIRKRIPALPEQKYPHLLVLMKNPDELSMFDPRNQSLDLGTVNGIALIQGVDGKSHLWGITPQGQVARPWIWTNEASTIQQWEQIKPPDQTQTPQWVNWKK